jgi:hypothetical protein
MRRAIEKFTVEQRFQSWGDALQYARQTPKGRHTKSRWEGEGRFDFTGTHSFEEAMTLAQDGWLEGSTNLINLSEAITNKLCSYVERHNVVYDVEGVECDVATALSGEPEFMMRWEPRMEQGEGKLCRMVINIGVSGSISKRSIMARGSVLVSLVQLLEYAGIRCEVTTFSGVDDAIGTWVRVKNADQPLDMPRLAFALAHPSFNRRVMFSVWEQYPEKFDNSYGCPENITDKGDIYAPCMYSGTEECNWNDEIAVKTWIISKLKEQGVSISL